MQALLIRSPHIDKILDDKKTRRLHRVMHGTLLTPVGSLS